MENSDEKLLKQIIKDTLEEYLKARSSENQETGDLLPFVSQQKLSTAISMFNFLQVHLHNLNISDKQAFDCFLVKYKEILMKKIAYAMVNQEHNTIPLYVAMLKYIHKRY